MTAPRRPVSPEVRLRRIRPLFALALLLPGFALQAAVLWVAGVGLDDTPTKDVGELALHESAFLAILPKAPEKYGRAQNAAEALERRLDEIAARLAAIEAAIQAQDPGPDSTTAPDHRP